ncbi:uncharacterized protein L969DRAFT_97091 [Mixia osmundae IAM 14324]|uniref:Glutamyl-tRNA(Gln) amidotransferase subunit F, mitochondrial n=1 Tax=Mixia osmundae (strain CBS 9802 / IAM 14324 / JCM 22182 / KY 12970) TaxID=764103 RepID=G7E1N2_MIXOS|nr:uncharacterized protein L969DRAFT_97091 [Mixia osmundae IAM 14324]KEI36692.1 hypothetical protein L969DRAFT_97091 [Mixia osmundae IAM 14324]GAA96742.1 hypothetical protein E5Q_03413 [Mixia osmundae IAM 14324]
MLRLTGLRGCNRFTRGRRLISVKSVPAIGEDALPLQPTWSVTDDIEASRTDKPISNEDLLHLHRLAALLPPPVDSPEWKRIQAQLSSLRDLIETVRNLPEEPTSVESDQVPDGRIWPQGRSLPLMGLQKEQGRLKRQGNKKKLDPDDVPRLPASDERGQSLLKLSNMTKDDFYLVPTPLTSRRK